jgi:hypothetical protein
LNTTGKQKNWIRSEYSIRSVASIAFNEKGNDSDNGRLI